MPQWIRLSSPRKVVISGTAYKPWVHTTSEGCLDGRLNGGAYIRRT